MGDTQGDSPGSSNARRHLPALLPASGFDQVLGEGHVYATVRAGVDVHLHRHPGLRPTREPAAR